jgi:DMATS type aromatic prenyltransferase
MGVRPEYSSNVADDEAPFELSIAFSDATPEIQFYVDPLGTPPTLESNMHTGRAALKAIAGEAGASLDRFNRIEDLFLPPHPEGAFAIWIGVSSAESGPRLKAYLNPQIRGRESAVSLVDEAMARLGLTSAWLVARAALSAAPEQPDELGILSLDLCGDPEARVKLYVRKHAATVPDIGVLVGLCSETCPEDTFTFYSTLAGNAGPFVCKPVIVELAFTRSNAERPASATLEFPLSSYVSNDLVARERVTRCLAAFGLETHRYHAALDAFASRPLEQRSGIHAHVTLRRSRGRPRIAVYLATEAYTPVSSMRE